MSNRLVEGEVATTQQHTKIFEWESVEPIESTGKHFN